VVYRRQDELSVPAERRREYDESASAVAVDQIRQRRDHHPSRRRRRGRGFDRFKTASW
jgi:hypothetical protein